MISLYHHYICPFSRQIRVLLEEKKIEYELVEINFWARTDQLIRLNPAGELPILVDNNVVIAGMSPVREYIEEKENNGPNFTGVKFYERAEARRLANWFNEKFYKEVTFPILNEKIIKYYKRILDTNSNIIRAAKSNMSYHLDYLDFLLKKSDWLAGDSLSIADLAAACQLSILDYFSDVPWEYNINVKNWYAIIKSRPSFHNILTDRVQGFYPAKHYENLDF